MKDTEISIQGPNVIYIVRQNLHTGLILPASSIKSRLPGVYDRFAGAPFIEFGWGDKAYYQTEEVTFGMTMKAIFWPTDSVIRTVAISERPDIHFADNEWEVLCLDQGQSSLLLAFIENSFVKDDGGNFVGSMGSTEQDVQFYKAQGDYFLWNTCNTWTAKGLKSAGLDISPAFKSTPGSVMSYLSKYNGGLPAVCTQPQPKVPGAG